MPHDNPRGTAPDDGDDEYSDTSVEEDYNNRYDYFLDRDLNYHTQIVQAKMVAHSRPIDNIEWSGQDIMQRFDPYKARLALDALNSIRVWPQGIHG